LKKKETKRVYCMSPAIEIENLYYAYHDVPTLENVNLQIKEGEFLALIGPNGGGKTTLLKLILGLIKQDSGTIRIFGKPPQQMSPRIGYVPQDIHVNRNFPVSALDVVLMGKMGPKKKGFWHSAEDRVAAHKALDRMDMGVYCHRRIGELSGGQRQRVLIARALVTEPDILLLDEPTSNIDSQGQGDFYELLKSLNEKITILLVSHDVMILSSYVKSVACVNRCVHYHDEAEVTDDMMNMFHCPVEIVAHGVPHRVLQKH
jgi:zinc transport system ATP-binding protein